VAESEVPVAEPEPRVETVVHVIRGSLGRGQTLSSSLRSQGVSEKIVQQVTQAISPLFDFRRSQPGHGYRLSRNEGGEVVEFRYRTSPVVSYRMRFADGDYMVAREESELRPRPARIAGVVFSNLYDAVKDLGESSQLASGFADIFAWDVDFSRNMHAGDEFQVLYERLYTDDDEGESVYVRPGRILAARYSGTVGDYTAIYFEETEDGYGGYYRPDGTSVEGKFLKAPLRYARISSSYTSARHHPILKITRPHYGIDYAAPIGTPIWAVADGEVIYKAPAGGFGNLVKIRHARGYVSYYAHMSRYISSLEVGQRVNQKQLIGYVGETGLATGPHVCFRVSYDGRYVNPAELRTPGGAPVHPAFRHAFSSARDSMLALMKSGTLLAATEEAL
jgi:murein DD-endopeptidase MepM/ murein hydrolase activator NlpD